MLASVTGERLLQQLTPGRQQLEQLASLLYLKRRRLQNEVRWQKAKNAGHEDKYTLVAIKATTEQLLLNIVII